jgi:hypothetical protein
MLAISLFLQVDVKAQMLYWSTHNKLQFSDFKFPVLEVPHKQGEVREIEYFGDIQPPGNFYMGISYALQKDEANQYVEYEIQATFYPNKSYITNRNDSETLNVAQTCFDITELFARKMRKFVCDNAFKVYSKVDFDSAIHKMNDEYLHFYERFRASPITFDQEINWSDLVNISLDSLAAYSKPFGTIPLK